jgi:hypothetical protein
MPVNQQDSREICRYKNPIYFGLLFGMRKLDIFRSFVALTFRHKKEKKPNPKSSVLLID